MTSTETADKRQQNKKRYAAYVLCLLLVIVLAAVVVRVFGSWFDLNDDFLIEHILSGAYTGTPESRDIQNLYPISLVISSLYRLLPGHDCYGAFLTFCQYASLLVILCRIMKITKTAWAKIGGAVIAVLLAGALLLYHFVFFQYSMTVGMMAAAAGFCFLTQEKKDTVRDTLKANILPVCILFAAYLLRSEMMIFTLPMTALCCFIRYCEDGSGIKMLFKRGFALLLVIGAGVLVMKGADALACSSPEWKEFRAFFDARTDLYDFHTYTFPQWEGNEDFYRSIGMDETEVTLINNYNFGLDDNIDSEKMEAIAERASVLENMAQTPVQRLKETTRTYLYNIRTGQNGTYGTVCAALYAMVLLTCLVSVLIDRTTAFAALRRALLLLLMFAGRSSLWLFLMYSNRAPDRLTHSLYLLECMILLTLLFTPVPGRNTAAAPGTDGQTQSGGNDAENSESTPENDTSAGRKLLFVRIAAGAAAAAVLFSGVSAQAKRALVEGARRDEVNVPYTQYIEYCEAHPDSFYFTDVYSTVAFSEKMSDNRKVMAANSDFMGGWANKSPLYRKKIASYGFTDMQSALLTDNCYFVSRSDFDTGWLTAYYAYRGIDIDIEPVDTVGDYFTVYKVSEG